MKTTIETGTTKNLGGVALVNSYVTPVPKPKLPKRHTQKHKGWIRGKKINGQTYYYYCWTERNGAGEYPEKSEYLGGPESVRDAVRAYKKGGS